MQISTIGLWRKDIKRSTLGVRRSKIKVTGSQKGQNCGHYILKMDEPILLQIGTSGMRGKGMKRPVYGVRKSRTKVTGSRS